MAGVMKPYIVRRGDYLAKLAFVHGFDADTVWQDPKNEELRNLRPDPNLLAPGDIIYLPEKTEQPLPIEKGTENNYSAVVPTVDVVLAFHDDEGNPLREEPCEIHGAEGTDGQPAKGQTDGEGHLALKVRVTTSVVTIHFPKQNVSFKVHVGDMDPDRETSGIRKRLQNLGYGYFDPKDDPATALAAAVRAFQASNGMTPTGTLDDDTRQALMRQYGV